MLENILEVITIEENAYLMKPIKEPETLNAILGLALDKALSLDKFSIHFYRAC
jgi:hypothetical protein